MNNDNALNSIKHNTRSRISSADETSANPPENPTPTPVSDEPAPAPVIEGPKFDPELPLPSTEPKKQGSGFKIALFIILFLLLIVCGACYYIAVYHPEWNPFSKSTSHLDDSGSLVPPNSLDIDESEEVETSETPTSVYLVEDWGIGFTLPKGILSIETSQTSSPSRDYLSIKSITTSERTFDGSTLCNEGSRFTSLGEFQRVENTPDADEKVGVIVDDFLGPKLVYETDDYRIYYQNTEYIEAGPCFGGVKDEAALQEAFGLTDYLSKNIFTLNQQN